MKTFKITEQAVYGNEEFVSSLKRYKNIILKKYSALTWRILATYIDWCRALMKMLKDNMIIIES